MPRYSLKKRQTMIAAARELLAGGHSLHAACKQIGCAQSAMSKWLNPPGDKRPRKTGRPRKLRLTPEESRKLQGLMLQYQSIPVAVEEFLACDGATPEARRVLGDAVNRARGKGARACWPVALREILSIPEVIAALYRGRKHARAFEPKARRDGSIEMEDGSRVQWAPGWIYESDDESMNEPYRFYDPGLGRETTGRQGLYTLDAASTCHLQADLCGRSHDVYRVEDIADHMLNVVRTHGLPVLWRLERGSWESNFVKGIEIKGRKERWGSLGDLFHISTKFESTGKPNIERSFKEQQKRTAHASTSIGSERGEFEQATRLRRAADKGNVEALRYFWTMAEAADHVAETLRRENQRPRRYPKLENLFTTPDALFSARVQRRDLLPEHEWYFLPVKTKATIRNGVIECKVQHYEKSFRFLTYGVEGFPVFCERHPVLIAFHPARPHEGCHVFNAAEGIKARGYAWGEKIGLADYFPDVPEEVLHGKGDFGQLQKAKAHLRAEYRTIVPSGTGPGTLKSLARDGLGNALVVQSGGPVPQASGSAPDPVRLPPAPVREIIPATNSRPLPPGVTRAQEIARLQAALEEA
jgi:hypothetical protein